MAKVSVIIPIYNVEKYLRECLDSVINQTLQDIEIICVNDGSTDNSLEILKKFAQKDKRIKVINQKNSGAAVARNIGIELAQGEFLAILDSDDIYKKEMLEIMYARATSTNSDIVICASEELNNFSKIIVPLENSLKKEYLPQKDIFSYKDVIKHVFDFCIGWSWDKLYKTSFIKNSNLQFQNLRSTNDAYFVFMSIIMAERISCVKEKLVIHRTNTGVQLSETREKDPTCFIQAIKAIKNELEVQNKYNEVEQSFLNWAVGFSIWHLSTIKGLSRQNQLAKIVKKEIVQDLKILEKEEAYFYKKSDYKKIINIDGFSLKINRLLKFIFSIKNSKDGEYKIVYILGIKFKVKNKKRK